MPISLSHVHFPVISGVTASSSVCGGSVFGWLKWKAIPVVSEEEEVVKPRWPEAPAVSGLERRSEGCPFAPRCPYALEVCWRQMPALERYAADHEAACHNPESLQA